MAGRYSNRQIEREKIVERLVSMVELDLVGACLQMRITINVYVFQMSTQRVRMKSRVAKSLSIVWIKQTKQSHPTKSKKHRLASKYIL